jgi:hypothetical protein
LKLVTFAKAQRTAVAVSARHLASPLAKQAAVSLTSSARTRKASNRFPKEMPPSRRHFYSEKGVKI